jgi:hypothetical protein
MIRHFKRVVFFFFISLLASPIALADVAPEITVDTEGYVNDAAREHAPDMPAVKKVKPKKVASTKKESASSNAPVAVAKAYVPRKKESGGSMMGIIIGASVVLLLIIGGVVFFVMKKKKSTPSEATQEEVVEKPASTNAYESTAQMESPKKTPRVPSAPQVDPLQTRVYAPPKISDDIAAATRIDERGCNPSGLIIDEDKYFDSDGSEFVDEDFVG